MPTSLGWLAIHMFITKQQSQNNVGSFVRNRRLEGRDILKGERECWNLFHTGHGHGLNTCSNCDQLTSKAVKYLLAVLTALSHFYLCKSTVIKC